MYSNLESIQNYNAFRKLFLYHFLGQQHSLMVSRTGSDCQLTELMRNLFPLLRPSTIKLINSKLSSNVHIPFWNPN